MTAAVESGRYSEIASSASAGTGSSTRSLTTSSPGCTVNDGRPPNVTRRSDPATISESRLRSATCTAPNRTGATPVAFDSVSRRRLPPTLARTIMRTVSSVNDRGNGGIGEVGGGSLAARGGGATHGGRVSTPSCSAVPHVATQCSPPSAVCASAVARQTSAASAARIRIVMLAWLPSLSSCRVGLRRSGRSRRSTRAIRARRDCRRSRGTCLPRHAGRHRRHSSRAARECRRHC